MDILKFAERMRLQVAELLNVDESAVQIREVQKNNSIVLHALTVHEKGQTISPTIYLESFYERYLEGELFDNLASEAAILYNNSKLEEFDIVSYVSDYEKCKHRIVCNLISTERNKDLLRDVPSVEVEDLSIVFRIIVQIPNREEGSILVKNDMLTRWGVEKEVLYEQAVTNTPNVCKPVILDMEEIMYEVFGGTARDLFSLTDEQVREHIKDVVMPSTKMYVVSNAKRINGAYSIMIPETMEKLAKLFDEEQFIVLPSSRHEVIAISYSEDYIQTKEMVQSVNEDVLSAEDVLSDTSYIVDVKNKQLIAVDRWEEYKKAQEVRERLKTESEKEPELAFRM